MLFSNISIKKRLLPCLVAMVIIPSSVNAQNVWAESNAKAKSKSRKAGNKVKQFKDHIQQWGTEQDFNKGLLLGGRLNSNGWSGGIYYLIKDNPGSHHIWQLHFSEIGHEKQIKQENVGVLPAKYGETTPYVFGKINNLYTLQIGYSKEQLLVPGVVESNLSVSFRYGGGFSLALLKPYYLKVVKTDYTQPEPVSELIETKYSDGVAELFLERTRILGSSKWSKGVDETKLVPGIYLETAFVIEPVPNRGLVQAITLGITGSVYTKSLPIMAELKAYNWGASLFAGLALGKRWR
jgi:hypothetical protein